MIASAARYREPVPYPSYLALDAYASHESRWCQPCQAGPLAVVALAATILVLATAGTAARARVATPERPTWSGLVGDRPLQVSAGQRQIVVLKAPSLAARAGRLRWAGERGGGARLDRRGPGQAEAAAVLSLAPGGPDDPARLHVHPGHQRFRSRPRPADRRRVERSPEVDGTTRCASASGCRVVCWPRRRPRRLRGRRTSGLRRPRRHRGAARHGGRSLAAVPRRPCAAGVRRRRGRPGRRPPRPAPRTPPSSSGTTSLPGSWSGAGRPRRAHRRAPGAAVVPIRVAGWQRNAGRGWAVYGRTDQVIAGLERAVDPNLDGDAHDAARVTLLGIVEPWAAFADGPAARAVRGALALDNLVVTPAGNDGPAGPGYGSIGPGGAPAALTVGAADLRPRARDVRVVVRTGLRVPLYTRASLIGAVAPRGDMDLEVGMPRGASAAVEARSKERRRPALADFFSADGRSLVAGRAAPSTAAATRPGPWRTPRERARSQCFSTATACPRARSASTRTWPYLSRVCRPVRRFSSTLRCGVATACPSRWAHQDRTQAPPWHGSPASRPRASPTTAGLKPTSPARASRWEPPSQASTWTDPRPSAPSTAPARPRPPWRERRRCSPTLAPGSTVRHPERASRSARPLPGESVAAEGADSWTSARPPPPKWRPIRSGSRLVSGRTANGSSAEHHPEPSRRGDRGPRGTPLGDAQAARTQARRGRGRHSVGATGTLTTPGTPRPGRATDPATRRSARSRPLGRHRRRPRGALIRNDSLRDTASVPSEASPAFLSIRAAHSASCGGAGDLPDSTSSCGTRAGGGSACWPGCATHSRASTSSVSPAAGPPASCWVTGATASGSSRCRPTAGTPPCAAWTSSSAAARRSRYRRPLSPVRTETAVGVAFGSRGARGCRLWGRRCRRPRSAS